MQPGDEAAAMWTAEKNRSLVDGCICRYGIHICEQTFISRSYATASPAKMAPKQMPPLHNVKQKHMHYTDDIDGSALDKTRQLHLSSPHCLQNGLLAAAFVRLVCKGLELMTLAECELIQISCVGKWYSKSVKVLVADSSFLVMITLGMSICSSN